MRRHPALTRRLVLAAAALSFIGTLGLLDAPGAGAAARAGEPSARIADPTPLRPAISPYVGTYDDDAASPATVNIDPASRPGDLATVSDLYVPAGWAQCPAAPLVASPDGSSATFTAKCAQTGKKPWTASGTMTDRRELVVTGDAGTADMLAWEDANPARRFWIGQIDRTDSHRDPHTVAIASHPFGRVSLVVAGNEQFGSHGWQCRGTLLWWLFAPFNVSCASADGAGPMRLVYDQLTHQVHIDASLKTSRGWIGYTGDLVEWDSYGARSLGHRRQGGR